MKLKLTHKDLTNLNVKIDKHLKEKVAIILRSHSNAKKKIGWNDLIEACLKRFLTEQ